MFPTEPHSPGLLTRPLPDILLMQNLRLLSVVYPMPISAFTRMHIEENEIDSNDSNDFLVLFSTFWFVLVQRLFDTILY